MFRWVFVVFGILQLCVLIYAWRRGGWPERVCASATTFALVIGWALPFDPGTSYRTVETARLAIDGALCLILVGVALWADRFWPLWVAALQLLSVAVHGVRAMDPSILPSVYGLVIEQFGWPIVALMWVGVLRQDYRQKVQRAPDLQTLDRKLYE